MNKMKMLKRVLLVFSLGASIFAVTFFNFERNSIYIGGTHYHGTPPETAGYVSADRNIDDGADVVRVLVSPDSHTINIDVIEVSPEEYITVIMSDDEITAHSEDQQVIFLLKPPSHDKIIITLPKDSPDIQHQKEAIISSDSRPEPLSFKGYLKTKDDTNTFTFTLDSACEVNISFTPSDGDKAYYVLSVHDSAGNTLTRKTIDSEKLYSDSGRLYLNAGKYTLKIQRGYSWSGKPYTLNVNTSHSADTESEPNNSPSTANTIPVNEDIRASTGTRNDMDYFAFTLEKPSSVTPSLNFHPVRFSKGIYSFKLYELEILDTDKKPFIFRGDGTPSRKIKPFILEADTYIISISRTESEELELGLHEYTLRVEAQEL